MKKSKDTETQGDSSELKFKGSPDDNVQSLNKIVSKLCAELETIKENIQKRKSENTALKILFYTGLAVLLVGFIYSNSKLQRAHIKSLERNIISLEQRILQDMNHIKVNLELEVQSLQKQLRSNGSDVFKTLDHVKYAVSRINPNNERTATLINKVRLNTDDLGRILEDEAKRPQKTDNLLIN